MNSAVLSLLGLARRAHVLVIGKDGVKSYLLSGKRALVLFPEDCAMEAGALVSDSSEYRESVFRVLNGIDRIALSTSIGTRNTHVVAVPMHGGFARSLMRLLPEGGIQFEQDTSL
jgi:ribosomal protein L7Ae-like RNA K-turn-binding protein